MTAVDMEMDDTPAADVVATLDGAAVIVFSIDVKGVGVPPGVIAVAKKREVSNEKGLPPEALCVAENSE